MAVPIQYQSQFIPTDFSTVGNLLGMYRQDMAQRNQEFDQAAELETSSLADIGSIPTYDLQGRESRMSELDRAISDTVSKYGGDYGAASKDIARIIAKERNNPWYQMNKQLYDTEQKRRELALDANNIILGDRYTTVADARKALAEGKDPYTVSALSKKDVFNTGEKIFSNFSDLILKDPTIRSTLGGQYWEQFTQRGYRPEDLDAFLSTGEGAQIMNSFVSTHPQLQGASEQQVREILKQSAYSAIGKEERNMYQNQGYVSPYESFRMRGQEQEQSLYPGTSYTGDPETLANIDNKIKADVERMSPYFDKDGNYKEPKGEFKIDLKQPGAFQTPAFSGATSGINPYQTGSVKYSGSELFKSYKDNYQALYESVKGSKGSDRDFIELVSQIERDKAQVYETKLRVNNDNFSGNLTQLVDNPSKMFLDKKGREKAYSDFKGKFKDAGYAPEESSMFLKPNGEIKIIDPEGDEWTLNKKHQSDIVKRVSNIMDKSYKDFYNYKLSSEDIKKINSTVHPMGGGKGVGIYINPKNPLQRTVVAYVADRNGNYTPQFELEGGIQELSQRMLPTLEEDLRKTLRKPKPETE